MFHRFKQYMYLSDITVVSWPTHTFRMEASLPVQRAYTYAVKQQTVFYREKLMC